jgi:hypothetical protein
VQAQGAKAAALLKLSSTAAAELTAQVSALQQSTDTTNDAHSSILAARIDVLAAAMQAQLERVRRLSSYTTTVHSTITLDNSATSSSASTSDSAEDSVSVMEKAVDTLVTRLRTGLHKLSLTAAKMTAAAAEHSLLEYTTIIAKHSSKTSSSGRSSSSAPQTCAGCKQRFRANHELKRALDVTLMSASSSRMSDGAFDYT